MQQKPVSLERVQQNGRSGGSPHNAIYHSARRYAVPRDARQIVFEVSLTNSRRDIGVETRETKGGAASPASSSRPFVLVPEVWGGQMA